MLLDHYHNFCNIFQVYIISFSYLFFENFMFFDIYKVWIFDGIVLWLLFGSIYTMQESSYLGNITLVSIWFRMVLTQIITHVYKNSLALT